MNDVFFCVFHIRLAIPSTCINLFTGNYRNRMDSKVSQYARAREQREEKFDFSSQFDTRSRKRAELIEEAKDKARELGANAIVGVKLETNANAGMFCMCPRPWHNKSSLLPLTFWRFCSLPAKRACAVVRESGIGPLRHCSQGARGSNLG